MITCLRAVFFAALILSAKAAGTNVVRNIEFARIDDKPLALDLHLPPAQKGPLIVWVHGGAWRSGSRSGMPLGDLVAHGYPVASVDYRLSTVARFPAQAH